MRYFVEDEDWTTNSKTSLALKSFVSISSADSLISQEFRFRFGLALYRASYAEKRIDYNKAKW